MFLDLRFWLIFLVLLAIAIGVQQFLFIIEDRRESKTRKKEDGIN
jgi:hypothetical protein